MADKILIRLPWPPTECRPNFQRSHHWTKWRSIGTKYRKLCAEHGWEMGVHLIKWPKAQTEMTYTFHPPKGCRWDKDAREAAFKSGQDGLADAMGLDDKWFNAEKHHGKTVEGGCVLVEITIPAKATGKVDLVGQVS